MTPDPRSAAILARACARIAARRAERAPRGRHALHDLAARYRLEAERGPIDLSPVGVMRAAGFEPDPWQVLLGESDESTVLVVTSRQAGKTMCVSAIAASAAAEGPMRSHPDAVVVVASPSFRQSARILARVRLLWRRVLEHHGYDPSVPTIVNRDPSRVIFSNGQQIIALPDNPNAVRGETAKKVIVEEAGYCGERLYAAVRPMRAATAMFGAQIIEITSAAIQGSVMHQEWVDVEAPGVLRIEVPYTELLHRISAEFIEGERRRMTASRFAAEYECQWRAPEGGAFRPEDIAAARGSWTSDWLSA